MTADAQSALRRTMETYSKITRSFGLILDSVLFVIISAGTPLYVKKRIIEPLASRCAKFRFVSLPHDHMISRLKMICDNEALNCDETVKMCLIFGS